MWNLIYVGLLDNLSKIVAMAFENRMKYSGLINYNLYVKI